MFSLIQTAIFFALSPLCHSAFNNQSDPRWCWDYNCVEEKSPGKICYYPAGGQAKSTFCSGGSSVNAAFQTVLDTHLNQSLSIAYYSPITNEQLGGVNYTLTHTLTPGTNVTLCLSGQVGKSNEYQTLCEPAEFDNDITLPGPWCYVTVAQHYVSDGCYIAMPNITNGTSGLPRSDKITLGTSISFGILAVMIAVETLYYMVSDKLWPQFIFAKLNSKKARKNEDDSSSKLLV